MAQVTYRANLSARSFPFLAENWGRTVIVPQYDQNYNAKGEQSQATDTDSDQQKGIPQVYYCHNVMPHDQGIQSIGYTDVLTPLVGASDFKKRFLLRDALDHKVYLGVKENGDFYVNDGTGWVYKNNYAAGKLVTVAYISGVCYIYIANTKCVKYDFSTNAFVDVTLTGLTAALVVGITYSYGYMIAWTTTEVVWSSTIDPTDFTPSLVTGAGGGAVESARGAINCVVPHTLGYIVYTTDNAVAALYQGNSRYPFQYREIVNSGGVSSLDLISWDANTQGQYVYSTSGMQLVSTSQTQTVFPEITNFVSGRYFEDFDDGTKTFVHTILTSAMKKKLTVVSDRYIVVSYGILELTHAIVYDISLKRYGKLKITHVECFEYQLVATGLVEIPRQSLAFLQKDGAVKVVDFSIGSTVANGTVILGKYQFVRPRLLQLDTFSLENVVATNSFSVTILSSIDGKNTTNVTPVQLKSEGLFREYGCRTIGTNHSLLMQGGWLLCSLVLVFNIHGKR